MLHGSSVHVVWCPLFPSRSEERVLERTPFSSRPTTSFEPSMRLIQPHASRVSGHLLSYWRCHHESHQNTEGIDELADAGARSRFDGVSIFCLRCDFEEHCARSCCCCSTPPHLPPITSLGWLLGSSCTVLQLVADNPLLHTHTHTLCMQFASTGLTIEPFAPPSA